MDLYRIDRSSDNADRLRVSVLVLAGFAVWTFLWLGPLALLVSVTVGALAYAVARYAADRKIDTNRQRVMQLLHP
jgi:hypothetical protein